MLSLVSKWSPISWPTTINLVPNVRHPKIECVLDSTIEINPSQVIASVSWSLVPNETDHFFFQPSTKRALSLSRLETGFSQRVVVFRLNIVLLIYIASVESERGATFIPHPGFSLLRRRLETIWWNEIGLQNGVAAARMHSISQLYKSQPKGDQSLN